MADTEILNVLLKLENPQLLDQIEKLKSQQFQIKFSGSIDKGIQDILALKDRKISITADVQGAINSLKGVETSLQSISKLQNIKLNLTGDVLTDLNKIQKKMLELQAINLTPQLSQLGAIQNNNPKTLQGGANSINQAQALKDIQGEFDRALNTFRAQAVNPNRQLSNDTVQRLANESTAGFNPGQIPRTQISTFGDQTQLTAKQSAARKQEAIFQAEDRRIEAQKDFERAQELAKAQVREGRLAKLRANAQGDFNSFFQEVQPAVGKVNTAFDTKTDKASQQAAKAGQARSALLKELGQSAAIGALQGQGAFSIGGSILGSLAGAGVPGGAAFGGLAGGAIGVGVEKSLEVFTNAIERAAEAGLSFETSILGISSILQATTKVSGANGETLSVNDQLGFQQGQARKIQKLARTKLLPLGISGDKESTLVQSIISGAAQRGIQLSPEQAATLAERLGGAIQSQRPELLSNSGQLRRDIEDLFSGSPSNTVLKTLTKGFAPGLGKATSAEDLIRRSEGLASFPESLKNSTTNPVVAAQKFNSAIDNLNTTFGDAIVTGLIPGINALAKALSNPDLLIGAEKFGELVGNIGSVLSATTVALSGSFKSVGVGIKGIEALATLGLGDKDDKVGQLKAKKALGLFSSEKDINAQIKAAQKEQDEKDKSKFKVASTSDVQIKALLEGTGLLDSATAAGANQKGGLAGLAALKNQKDLLPIKTQEDLDKANAQARAAGKSGITDDQRKDSDSAEFTARLAISLQKVDKLRAASTEISNTLDSSSPLGALNKLQVGSTFAGSIREEAENSVRLARIKRNELGADAKQADINKADTVLRDATFELIKARNDEKEAIDAVKQAELSRTKALRDSQFDSGTIQGRAGLISSGQQDARDRIANSAADIKSLKGQLGDSSLDPLERANLRSRLEKATLEFNQGQIGKAQLSREAQNNAIDLAQGPVEAKKALADFNRATLDAADKFASLAQQLDKSKEILADFDSSKKIREFGREGTIIDAAEKAIAASGGADSLDSLSVDNAIPSELQGLVKGSRGFDADRRAAFERNKASADFEGVLRLNSPERFASDEEDKRAALVRGVGSNERALGALPGEELSRKFAGLKQLVGLQQQGIDVGSEGRDFITKQAKDLGINLPKLETAETVSADLPSNVASIDTTVKSILALLGGGTVPTASAPAGAATPEEVKPPSFLSQLGSAAKTMALTAASAGITNGVHSLFPLLPTDNVDLNSIFGDQQPEEVKKITSGVLDNPINFSDLTAPRANLSNSAYNPVLKEGLAGTKAKGKDAAIFEDVVGGFLDADVDGLKKQNRAPASGLKNGLFSGGLFADNSEVKSGKGTAESNGLDSLGSKIDENFNKLGDIITKALGGAF